MREQTPEEVQAASAEIRRHVENSEAWEAAGAIGLFAAQAREPDLDALLPKALAAGKTVAYPRVTPDGLSLVEVASAADLQETQRWRLREPGAPHLPVLDLEEIDLLLVPGLAFDARGRRMGRGGGFYDRLLSGARRARRLGICFALQLVPEVPVEPHDQPVQGVVTERGLYESSSD